MDSIVHLLWFHDFLLSRDKCQVPEHPEPVLPSSLIVSPIQWSLDNRITETTASERAPPGCPPDCIHVPRSQRNPLMESAHSFVSIGHLGTNQSLTLLQPWFWWPGMAQDFKRFIQGCQGCAKIPRHLPSGQLLPLPFHTDLGHAWEWTSSPTWLLQMGTRVLVKIDRFSKACRLFSLKGLPTTMETAELMFNHVFHNFILFFVSERGPQFISCVWKAFFTLLCVTTSHSSGYHPQTNGQTERKIQEIARGSGPQLTTIFSRQCTTVRATPMPRGSTPPPTSLDIRWGSQWATLHLPCKKSNTIVPSELSNK